MTLKMWYLDIFLEIKPEKLKKPHFCLSHFLTGSEPKATHVTHQMKAYDLLVLLNVSSIALKVGKGVP